MAERQDLLALAVNIVSAPRQQQRYCSRSATRVDPARSQRSGSRRTGDCRTVHAQTSRASHKIGFSRPHRLSRLWQAVLNDEAASYDNSQPDAVPISPAPCACAKLRKDTIFVGEVGPEESSGAEERRTNGCSQGYSEEAIDFMSLSSAIGSNHIFQAVAVGRLRMPSRPCVDHDHIISMARRRRLHRGARELRKPVLWRELHR